MSNPDKACVLAKRDASGIAVQALHDHIAPGLIADADRVNFALAGLSQTQSGAGPWITPKRRNCAFGADTAGKMDYLAIYADLKDDDAKAPSRLDAEVVDGNSELGTAFRYPQCSLRYPDRMPRMSPGVVVSRAAALANRRRPPWASKRLPAAAPGLRYRMPASQSIVRVNLRNLPQVLIRLLIFGSGRHLAGAAVPWLQWVQRFHWRAGGREVTIQPKR